jgi:hypothetical protein
MFFLLKPQPCRTKLKLLIKNLLGCYKQLCCYKKHNITHTKNLARNDTLIYTIHKRDPVTALQYHCNAKNESRCNAYFWTIPI